MRENVRLRVALFRSMLDPLKEEERVEVLQVLYEKELAAHVADLRREISYDHWHEFHRAAFRLSLKWFYAMFKLPVPEDLR